MKDEHVLGGVALLAATALAVLWSAAVVARPDTWQSDDRWAAIVAIVIVTLVVAVVVQFATRTWWFVLVAVGVTLLGAVPLFTPRGWLEREGLLLIVVWIVLANVVAGRWTRTSMRVVLALGVGFTLLLGTRVGRAEILAERAADVRRAATALDSRRVQAVQAVAPSTALTARSETAQASVALLCQRAGGELRIPDLPQTDPPRPASTPIAGVCTKTSSSPERRTLQEAARAQAVLDVTATEEQATPTPEREAALAEATTALVSTTAGDQPEVAPTAIVDVLTAGAARVARAMPGLGSTDVPMALAVVGWLILGGLLLLGYRHLEITSSQRGRGVVTFGDLVGTMKASTAPPDPPDHEEGDGHGTAGEPEPPERPETSPPEPIATTVAAAAASTPAPATGAAPRGVGAPADAAATIVVSTTAPPREVAAMTNDELQAAFRRHVLMNVDEPGAIPGGEAKDPVTDLLETSSDPVSKILASLLKVVRGLGATTPGYKVDATFQTILPDGDGEATSYEVFVRILRARTGTTVRTRALRARTPTLAVRSAGYWTAAYILACDRTAPSWARWDEAAATAMATWDEAAASGGTPRITDLEQAARLAPASGLVLTRLANQYDMQHDHVKALELHLRTVTCHPRYPIARYRLALSFGLVYAEDPSWWTDLAPEARLRISRSIQRCWTTCRPLLDADTTVEIEAAIAALADDAAAPELDEEVRRAHVEHIAEGFRQSAAQLVARPMVFANAFRMAERRYWFPLLRPLSGRTDRHRLTRTVLSARYVLRERFLDPLSDDEATRRRAFEEESHERRTWWQVAYNLACAHAISAGQAPEPGATTEKGQAVALLERIAELDGGGQLGRAWVDADPDLEPLGGDPGFVAFRAQLPGAPDPGSAGDNGA